MIAEEMRVVCPPDTVLLRLNLNRGNGKNLCRHCSDVGRITLDQAEVDTVYSL